jgi:hypothetical protein
MHTTYSPDQLRRLRLLFPFDSQTPTGLWLVPTDYIERLPLLEHCWQGYKACTRHWFTQKSAWDRTV